MKTCTKCGKEKPSTKEYFHKSKISKDGLHTQCKGCRLKERKLRYKKEKELGITKAYYELNRIRHLVQAMKKRGYKNLTTDELDKITSNFQTKEGINQCPYCDRELEEREVHYDHLIPHSKGGANILTNIIPVCKYCNRSKMNDDFSEWFREQFFYSKRREENIWKYFLGRKIIKFYKPQSKSLKGECK